MPRESKFDAKFLFMVFNRKIFWVAHLLCALPDNLSLKTPVLVELVNKW